MAPGKLWRNRPQAGPLFLSVFLLFTVVLAGCGNRGNGSTTVHHKNSVTVVANQAGDLVKNFNPFSGNVISGTQGLIYETLLFFNRVDSSVHSWLAESYEFSPDATTVTFHLHPNITWSDGQPFSSADVKFTLDLLVKYPDLDLNGITPFIKSVSTPDASTVVVVLTQPDSPLLWYLGGQTYIVPQHKWSTIKGDPGQYSDENPVGTGPFTMGTFTPQLLTLDKNSHYWQAGKPAVQQVKFPAFSSNTSSELVLNNDGIDWNGQYTPDIEKTYVKRDPQHHFYWFPPSDVVLLYLNLAKYPFNQLPVRQAISNAINRDRISSVAESGYEPVTSPTGLVLPASQKFLDPQYASAKFSVNSANANTLLTGAGFTRGADGIYADKNGKKLSFSIIVPEGWTDWITTCQFMSNDLKAIGMDVSVDTVDYDAFYNDLQLGQFDSALWGTNAGPSPYFIYDSLLRSTNGAPLGKQAGSNFERWNDPETDKLLNQYATSTDQNIQTQAIYGLQKIMVEQLPSIPLMNEPYWYEFNTLYWVGWPDAAHPYAEPAPYSYPDNEMVLLNLRPS
ncbi:MAG TPA: ABC transporter substrate-binding protein [Ktedonobacteraceae bacterium]|nr:ABC transporter substrate-binding protein [Ktedonobacteraceae bacterium]